MSGPVLDRRLVLASGAAAGGGLWLGWAPAGAASNGPSPLNPWVAIAPDNRITITAHNPEVGQGVKTSFPMMVAEELDADWAQVTVRQARGDRKTYGRQVAGGSMATTLELESTRRMGATARAMLVQAAARRWGVPAGEITTAKGRLSHRSGKTATYGEMAGLAATLPAPDPRTVPLKDPKDFRLLGTRVTGVDNPALVQGKPLFGIDTRLPGMVHAAYARSPVFGATLKSADLDAARKVPGVLAVFPIAERRDLAIKVDVGLPGIRRIAGGVAVLATSTWAALQGRDALNARWNDGDATFQSSEAWARAAAAALAKGPEKTLVDTGDAPGRIAAAKRTVKADYEYPFLAHAALEPMTATVWVKDDSAEVWASTQTPTDAKAMVAAVTGLPLERITVNIMRSGGGFGRKLMNDIVAEAAAIAMVAKVPVKLTWDRGQDFAHDWLRPGGWQRLTAALDDKGDIAAWHTHYVSYGKDGVLHPTAGLDGGLFPAGVIDHYRAEATVLPIASTLGWLRAPINNAFAFVTQGFIDECAHAAGRDAVEYRRAVLGAPRAIALKDGEGGAPYHTGRMRGVLDKAAAMAGWGRKLAPRTGMGIAFHFSHLGYFANVVQASVGDDGAVRVGKVWVAADVGRHIVNLSGAENQVQGSVIDALGAALGQAITFRDGAVEQRQFDVYPLARIGDAPAIEIAFLATDFPTTGLGEPAYPSLAPALAGAIFAATGVRLRRLPFDTDLLKA